MSYAKRIKDITPKHRSVDPNGCPIYSSQEQKAVAKASASDFLLLRPLDGEAWEETGVHLALEPVEKILAPTQDQEYDKEALVVSLRDLLRSFTQESFTDSGNFTGPWEYMAFGAAMYGNMLIGALQGLGCDPKEELQRARVTRR